MRHCNTPAMCGVRDAVAEAIHADQRRAAPHVDLHGLRARHESPMADQHGRSTLMSAIKPGRPPGRPPADGQPATSTIVLRVTPSRKADYVRAARPGTLSAWICEVLDRACGRDRK